MATAQGPASGTAAYFFGGTCGVEVQVPNGLPSLNPNAAPYIDPQSAFAGTVLNKAVGTSQYTNPS